MYLIFCFLWALDRGWQDVSFLLFVLAFGAYSIPPVYLGFSLILLIYFSGLPIKKVHLNG